MRYNYPTAIVLLTSLEEEVETAWIALCQLVRDEGISEEQLIEDFQKMAGYKKEAARKRAKTVMNTLGATKIVESKEE
jgi:hypothetical protein